MPTEQDQKRYEPKCMTCRRIVVTILLGCLLVWFLPSHITDEFGAQKIAKLAAPFSGLHYDESHRKDITVLLIDEESLRLANERWPASFHYYSVLLRQIAKTHPRAVFIDVILAHHENAEARADFEKAVADVNGNSRTPIVFVAARRTPDNKLWIGDEGIDLEDTTKVSVEFSPNEVDHIAWTYPLSYNVDSASDAGSVDKHMKTASLSTVDGVQHKREVEGARSAALAIYEDALIKAPPRPIGGTVPVMDLIWGMDTAADGVRWKFDDQGENARESALIYLDRNARKDGLYCTSDDSDAELYMRAQARAIVSSMSRPLCVFHRTINASSVSFMTPAEVAEAFGDRVVMIGTAGKYSDDVVMSPLHGPIPNVFLHAMALDNLLVGNGEYLAHWQPTSPFEPGWIRFAALTVIGVVPAVIVRVLKDLLKHRVRVRWERPRNELLRRHWWARKLSHVAFVIALMLASGILIVFLATAFLIAGQTLMHVPFLTVAHLTACIITVEWFEWGNGLANWIWDVKEND